MLTPAAQTSAEPVLGTEDTDEVSSWIMGSLDERCFNNLSFTDGCSLLRDLQAVTRDGGHPASKCLHETQQMVLPGYGDTLVCRSVYFATDWEHDCRPDSSRRSFAIRDNAVVCGFSQVTPETSRALYSYVNRCFSDGWTGHTLRQKVSAKDGFEREVEQRVLTRPAAGASQDVVEMCGTPYLRKPERGAEAGAPEHGWVWNLWMYPADDSLKLGIPADIKGR